MKVRAKLLSRPSTSCLTATVFEETTRRTSCGLLMTFQRRGRLVRSEFSLNQAHRASSLGKQSNEQVLFSTEKVSIKLSATICLQARVTRRLTCFVYLATKTLDFPGRIIGILINMKLWYAIVTESFGLERSKRVKSLKAPRFPSTIGVN